MHTIERAPPSLRVVTYNVHGCVGNDGARSVDRIADVLRACDADVIGLQEIDVGRDRSGGIDQAEAIALRLGMTHVFGAALYDGRGCYGNAILSRHGMEHVRTRRLPTWRLWSEPRCFVHARVDLPGEDLDVVVTHFGLEPIERLGQAHRVAREVAAASPYTVLLGDLNCGRGTLSYARIARTLRDAQHEVDPRAVRATYPAWRAMLRLDHVFVGRGLEVLGAEVPDGVEARLASDHLPVTVTVRRRPDAGAGRPWAETRAQARLA
jgi:endonuclease/exonuclease/phosphatase family metal-dependent hydrolase